MVEAQRRMIRGRRVIAVTGSAGKTSTTAMLAHALRAVADDAKVQYDPRDRKYLHWALAYMSRVHRFDHTFLEVSEAVLSQAGDDFSVSADVAIVTSIAEAHLEYHGSLEGSLGTRRTSTRVLPVMQWR
jgi:UDP-N-acetylmuramoyl-tripeptide--D-alanyl-D-alanine ligase